MDPSFPEALEAAKRASTAQLLFKCARLVNERALATIAVDEGQPRPRPAHMALFPHIALEGTRQSEVARELGISKQAVGQLVGELEAMGILERRPDPDDGRAKRVVFTKQGLEGMLEGIEHLRRIENELAKAIGKNTMAALRAALLVLHDHLDG